MPIELRDTLQKVICFWVWVVQLKILEIVNKLSFDRRVTFKSSYFYFSMIYKRQNAEKFTTFVLFFELNEN